MLMVNRSLTSLVVTGNKLGEGGGKLLQEGMEENKNILTFDLRLTAISQESEYCIEQIIKTNSELTTTPTKTNNELSTTPTA